MTSGSHKTWLVTLKEDRIVVPMPVVSLPTDIMIPIAHYDN